MFGLSITQKIIVLLCVAFICFMAGWQTHGWKFSHDQARSIAKVKKTSQKAIVEADKIIDQSEKQHLETKIIYRTIRERIDDENDTRICFADQRALSLWNDAIAGKNTPGSEFAAAARKVDSTENEEIVATVKDVLKNATDNYEICNRNAARHQTLIDVLKVYNDKMCVCHD